MKSKISTLLLLFATAVLAQDMPKVVPPSPEAASAFKFTEMPVSLYTGMPNITIPLFEIESGGVTVPISLSYHARGVQVAEVASRVGTGWTLNAGGMISRQVRGLPDTTGAWGGCYQPENFYSDFSVRHVYEYDQMAEHQICDLIPDAFSYSINGVSGKAIGNGEALLQQKYDSFKLGSNGAVDGAGNSYSFEAIDYDRVLENKIYRGNGMVTPYGIGITTDFRTTWHLTKIKTAKGLEIKFRYTNESSYFWRRNYDKNVAPNNESHISRVKTDQQRLDSIMFDKGKLIFEYHNTMREDVEGGHSLSKITLYDKVGKFIKQVKFDYQYTTSIDDNDINYYLKSVDTFAVKRLFLKSVTFLNEEGDELPPYTFIYDETILPSRHSNKVDGWGYYNGKNNGSFLETALDDRTVDPVKVQAGLLKTMVKPEGGSVNFYYEPNIGVNIFPETVWFESTNPTNHKVVGMSNLSATLGLDPDTGLPYYNQAGVWSDVFTVSEFKTGHAKYNASGSGVDGCDCGGRLGCIKDPAMACTFTIMLQKWDIVQANFLDYEGLFQGQQRIINLTPGKYKLRVKYNGSGTPNVMSDNFIVSLSWNEEIASYATPELVCTNEKFDGTKVIYAAGNRIRKIEYIDAHNTVPIITKSYSYTDPGGSPSGRILGITNLVAVKKGSIQGTGNQTQPGLDFAPWGTGGGAPFTTYQGNNIGYKHVTEYYGEGDNTIGRIDYEYSMIYDTGRYYEYPYHPPTDNEWLRGKEVRVKYYKKNNNNYQIVKSVENSYNLGDSFDYTGSMICNHPLLKPSLRIPLSENIPQNGGYEKNKRYYTIPLSITHVSPSAVNLPDPNAQLGYLTYYLTGGTMDLSKTTTTDYFDDGSQLQTVDEYFYDYDNHYNVAEHHQTTSIGSEKIITKYYYPADPEMAGKPAVADLLAMNMREIPLVTQTYKDGTKLSETETAFKDWKIGEGLLVMPEYIKTAKSNNTLENKIQYTKLDAANGNILEVRQVDGNYVSYIWGYGGTYPIAKIENATFQQVLTATGLSEAGLKALTEAPSTLRTALPNALVTTYEYTPLVGVTKITDPNGKNTHYEYDQLKRLKAVKDHYNNLLSETHYNYRPSTP